MNGWQGSYCHLTIRKPYIMDCSTSSNQRDQGETWKRISPDLSHNDPTRMGDVKHQTIFTISESPVKKGLIYVGTDDGRVWVTKDDGGKWEEIVAGIAKDRWISRVVASKLQ
ncbi:MAG: hypothetical protein MZV63_34025 [Marinilabiliales bacterium]|nr:hypothetical protein [Marinilabiliales bacterium]